MRLAVIGSGYVGLVAAVCFAESGNEVLCVDVDAAKVERLRRGELTIYEPGLQALFERNLREGRLRFTQVLADAIAPENEAACRVIFLALPTPMAPSGEADLSFVLGVSQEIGKLLKEGHERVTIVTKSTVPVGTVDLVREQIASHAQCEFDVVSNPEFLREGVAVEDFLRPERVIIGTDSPHAEKVMRELYRPFLLSGNPLLVMDARSAELTKYAANAMLALRISFMNDIANLCAQCEADVDRVRLGMGLDSRIGKRFLFAGIGYGGSCFGKDVQALIATGEAFGAPQRLLEATQNINREQKTVLMPPILKHFDGDLSGKKFALWGLSFKPNTDDMRDAPSLELISALLEQGAQIIAYDPEAMDATRKILGEKIEYAARHYEACRGADALIIATEWNVFREPDFEQLQRLLKSPLIFDGRNVYDLQTVREAGFAYYSIGRPSVNGAL